MEALKAFFFPKSPIDYIRLGPVYFGKKLFGSLWVTGAVALLAAVGLPAGWTGGAEEAVPVFRWNDTALLEMAGTVKLLDEGGTVRYEGEVAAGACTGLGKVYDASGQLVYEGPLVNNCYEGEGGTLYQSGKPVYTGAFLQNKMEGQGAYTDPDTNIVSTGIFTAGAFTGEGTQSRNGTLLREGTFLNGRLNGIGKEYGDAGVLLCEGNYVNGRLEGEGTAYRQDGSLLYTGAFQNGSYQGEGTLYGKDGSPSYTGEFRNGKAFGSGTLYNELGQAYYTGLTRDGRVDARTFVGRSMEDLEKAFTVHMQIYLFGKYTAFAYPAQKLIFVTENPVPLESAAEKKKEEEKQKAEAEAGVAAEAGPPEPAAQAGEAQNSNAPSAAAAISAPDRAKDSGGDAPVEDYILSADIVKKDILISEVISVGEALPGVTGSFAPQEKPEPAPWRECFSSYLNGKLAPGFTASKKGEFITEFTQSASKPGKSGSSVEGGASESETVWAEDGGQKIISSVGEKSGNIIYQAVRGAEPSG